jgi:hypothetical protein
MPFVLIANSNTLLYIIILLDNYASISSEWMLFSTVLFVCSLLYVFKKYIMEASMCWEF